VTRAAAIFGAALTCAVSTFACTAATSPDAPAAADRDLFVACTPALVAAACGGHGDGEEAGCLASKGAAFRRLRSPRMRRSWLISYGCPAGIVDAPPPATAAASVVEPAAPALQPAPAAPAAPALQLAPAAPAAPPPAEPSPLPSPRAEAPPPAPRTEPAPVVTVAPPKPRPGAREERLRDLIVAHGTEMKSCVERQLKLLPTLRAEGTLVIEVSASGAVPRAALVGPQLAGTQLETCLQTVASRWRFPRAGRAYRIDAPVRVWGSGLAR
jgi:hypothetical protein